jgi:hypothetical protein
VWCVDGYSWYRPRFQFDKGNRSGDGVDDDAENESGSCRRQSMCMCMTMLMLL